MLASEAKVNSSVRDDIKEKGVSRALTLLALVTYLSDLNLDRGVVLGGDESVGG